MVGGEEVHATVADYRRCGADGVESPLEAGSHGPLLGAAASGSHGAAGAVGGVGEVEQVGAFGLVELEGAGDRVEDACGHAAE
jgi:hypothetical protein